MPSSDDFCVEEAFPLVVIEAKIGDQLSGKFRREELVPKFEQWRHDVSEKVYQRETSERQVLVTCISGALCKTCMIKCLPVWILAMDAS